MARPLEISLSDAAAPAITVAPPSAQALQQKIEFEHSRLLSWFGG